MLLRFLPSMCEQSLTRDRDHMKRTVLGGDDVSLILDIWSLKAYGTQSGDVCESLGCLSP